MKRAEWAASVAIVMVVVFAGFVPWSGVAATAETDKDEAVTAPRRVSVVNGEPVVTLDAGAQRETGIATLRLRNEPHRRELRAWASVLDPQPIAELAARRANARAQLDIARAKLAASGAAHERAQKLYKDRQNISAAELQSSEAAFRVDQAGLAAAQAQLRAVTTTAQQGWGPVLGRAIAENTELPQLLTAGQEMLLQVTLRPGQMPPQPSTEAVVRLDGGGRQTLRFLSAATRTNPRLQGPGFFYTAPATGGLLPGMTVIALLPDGPPVDAALVPPQAIVWGEGRAWVYFRVGDDSFARRPVATDLPAPGGGYLVRGIDGSEIVVAGAQTLFSEEFRTRLRGTEE